MHLFGISHRLALASLACLFVFSTAYGQKGPATASVPSTGPVSGPTTSRFPTTTTNNPTGTYPGTQPGVNTTPIFLSGRVAFDDGSPINKDIRIERVCNGSAHLEAHVDSKGRFSFQLGQENALDTDAADQTSGIRQPGAGYGNSINSPGMTSRLPGTLGPGGLANCELRASYPGYRSDSLSLAGRQALDSPELGTILLHRLTNVQGTTTSATTLAAPKGARKEYEKGMALVAKGKFEEAEQHLAQATTAYPQYAVAWFTMGQIDAKDGHLDEAQKAFQSAIKADSHYVSPYDGLALINAQQGKWPEAAEYSKQAISLNPVEFPSSFWYNAVANYNLKNFGESEKSTRALLQLDSQRKYPVAEKMLAELLLEKGNTTEAAVHMRAYLAAAPNAKDAAAVRESLAKLEKANPAAPASPGATPTGAQR